MLNEELFNKWKEVLDHADLPAIKDPHRRASIAQVLENTERALSESAGIGAQQYLIESPIAVNFMGGSSSTQGTGGIDIFDPILISLVRRAMPNLIAGKKIVPELIQRDFTSTNVFRELSAIIPDGPARRQMQSDLTMVQQRLHDSQDAASPAQRAAQEILAALNLPNSG